MDLRASRFSPPRGILRDDDFPHVRRIFAAPSCLICQTDNLGKEHTTKIEENHNKLKKNTRSATFSQ